MPWNDISYVRTQSLHRVNDFLISTNHKAWLSPTEGPTWLILYKYNFNEKKALNHKILLVLVINVETLTKIYKYENKTNPQLSIGKIKY